MFRYHAIFTDNLLGLVDAEAQHCGHAVVEQVIADLGNSALAHLPVGAVHGEMPPGAFAPRSRST